MAEYRVLALKRLCERIQRLLVDARVEAAVPMSGYAERRVKALDVELERAEGRLRVLLNRDTGGEA